MELILTREKALELHRKMWSDMQKELGDCPNVEQRDLFKYRWCHDNTPEAIPFANCYLCGYAIHKDGACKCCPIDWGKTGGIGCMGGNIDFRYSPISAILALSERKEVLE